jgi:hypothetical protein
MIPTDKFLEIARGLLEKTKQEKAKWTAKLPLEQLAATSTAMIKLPSTARKDIGPPQFGEYVLKLPNSMLELEFVSPSTEPDRIILRFRNSTGLEVGRWEVEEESPDWSLAAELYDQVERCVTGWDKVLQDVEVFLAGDAKNTPISGGRRQ